MKILIPFLTAGVLSLLLVSCKSVSPVATGEASDITFNSATLDASVKPSAVKPGAEIGIMLSKDQNPSQENGEKIVFAGQADENGNFSVAAAGLGYGITYYYKAYLLAEDKSYEGEVKSFTTEDFPAVDLGLSVKWAAMNVGANTPDEAGGSYAWAETETKDYYSWKDNKWCTGTYTSLTKYSRADKKTRIELADDVANVTLGGDWRMPTDAEWTELRTKCKWNWTSQNGVNGMLVTADNGNSIFLPVSGNKILDYKSDAGMGFYWSANIEPGRPHIALQVRFGKGSVRSTSDYRCTGCLVRAVKE